jgi:hypothetical protein
MEKQVTRMRDFKWSVIASTNKGIDMVHPNAELSDILDCIQGCSGAVILRKSETSDGSVAYRVIGGALPI